jgi:hypothetical protein
MQNEYTEYVLKKGQIVIITIMKMLKNYNFSTAEKFIK